MLGIESSYLAPAWLITKIAVAGGVDGRVVLGAISIAFTFVFAKVNKATKISFIITFI
jgi:hypothetical protein